MKNISRHVGKLEILDRLPSSTNGNPRYLLRVAGFTCKTPVDSMYGYSVPNYNGKDVVATIGTHYGTATLASVQEAQS
jgi:hypothetical protein